MAFGTTTVSSLFTAPADQAAPPNFNYSFSCKNLSSEGASGEAVKNGYRTFSPGDRMETPPGEERLLFVLWPYVLPLPFSSHLVISELTGIAGENNARSSIPVDCRNPKRSHMRKLLYL